MSHYADIEVDYEQKNEKDLVAALEKQFGEGSVEVHEKGAALYGFQGDNRAQAGVRTKDYAPPCELIIRRNFVGGSSNDLGFKRVEDGKYKMYLSDYDSGHNFDKAKQGRVAQEYALRVAEQKLKAEGWKTYRTSLDDGSVKITAKDQVAKIKLF